MSETGHTETVPARDLRIGDVFSTDGGTVTSVMLLQGGGTEDEIAVETVCHGTGKSAYLAPDFPCHLWREDDPRPGNPEPFGDCLIADGPGNDWRR